MDKSTKEIFGILMMMLLLIGIGRVIAGAATAEVIQAREIYVIDEDTIDVGDERVRVVGFDTPETYQEQ